MGTLSKHRNHTRDPPTELESQQVTSSAKAISTLVAFPCTQLQHVVHVIVDLQSTGRRAIHERNNIQDVLSAQFYRRFVVILVAIVPVVWSGCGKTAPPRMCSSRVDFCERNVLIRAFDRHKRRKLIEPIFRIL